MNHHRFYLSDFWYQTRDSFGEPWTDGDSDSLPTAQAHPKPRQIKPGTINMKHDAIVARCCQHIPLAFFSLSSNAYGRNTQLDGNTMHDALVLLLLELISSWVFDPPSPSLVPQIIKQANEQTNYYEAPDCIIFPVIRCCTSGMILNCTIFIMQLHLHILGTYTFLYLVSNPTSLNGNFRGMM